MLAIFASALGAAALGVGSSLLQNKSGAPEQSLGSNTSGNVTDTRPPPFPRANDFLSTQTGSVVKGVASQFLGDYRQRRANKNRFSDLKDEGLTPQEIMGGGGGAVQAQGNTLGSGPMVQAQTQRDFQSSENAKQRAHEIEKTKLQTQPAHRQATVSEGKFGLDLNLHPKVMQKLYADVEKLEVQIKRANIDIENIWPLRFSAMSPTNGMFSLAAFARGIDLKRVLQSKGDITEEEWEQTITLYNDFIKITSGTSNNLLGFGQLFNQVVEGEDTLTNPFNKKIGTGKIIKHMKNPNMLNPKSPSFGRVWR